MTLIFSTVCNFFPANSHFSYVTSNFYASSPILSFAKGVNRNRTLITSVRLIAHLLMHVFNRHCLNDALKLITCVLCWSQWLWSNRLTRGKEWTVAAFGFMKVSWRGGQA